MIFKILLQAALLSLACSVDCLVTGFAYGTNKIKISFSAALIINLICASVLAVSLFLGDIIGKYIPSTVTIVLCTVVLCLLGLCKIATSIVKQIAKKNNGINKDIKFSLFSLKFLLNISANPQDADVDNSKALSIGEAVPLSIALSFDGIAVGLGAGIAGAVVWCYVAIIVLSLVLNICLLLVGRLIGDKIAKKAAINLSWLSGLLLIGLAIVKLFV